MHKKTEEFSETLERYCRVIDSNTTVKRTYGENGVKYECIRCGQQGEGGCSSIGHFEPRFSEERR